MMAQDHAEVWYSIELTGFRVESIRPSGKKNPAKYGTVVLTGIRITHEASGAVGEGPDKKAALGELTKSYKFQSWMLMGEFRSGKFTRDDGAEAWIRPDNPEVEFMIEMKTCEQCHQDYVKGEGATEPGPSRVRLTERFCSDTCAREYVDQVEGDEGGEAGE
jgi:hypothetical protein